MDFSFLVERRCAGDTIKVRGPESNMLSFTVPEGLDSEGELICLKRKGGAWSFESSRPLPRFVEDPIVVPSLSGPYRHILEILLTRGYFDKLPLSEEGVLQVSVPFCGRFSEYPLLGDFLAEHAGKRVGATATEVFGTEVSGAYAQKWAEAERWCTRVHPQVLQMSVRIMDLAEDPLPGAGLVLLYRRVFRAA